MATTQSDNDPDPDPSSAVALPSASRLRRGAALGTVAARSAGRSAFTRLATLGRGLDERTRRAHLDAMSTAEEIVDVLGSMKGAAMKIGQMLSLIDLDLVPEESRDRFQRKLAVLRDNAPAVDNKAMLATLDDELGSARSLLAELDPAPVAAASIGQVYRGQLRDGRAVAVKIQYPGIETVIEADLRNLSTILRLSRNTLPNTDMSALVDEITGHLRTEVDYRHEAIVQHAVAARYRTHPYILIPDIIEELCGSRVLVTEWAPGVGLSQVYGLDQDLRNQIGEIIYRFYCGGAYLDGGFSGDPHPGNVILCDDGRVAFLDFGLYKLLPTSALTLERDVLRYARTNDLAGLHRTLSAAGILHGSDVTPELAMAYLHDAAWWHLQDEVVTITPAIANSTMVSAVHPASEYFDTVRAQSLPGDHIFTRRAEFYTCAMLGQLSASHNWFRIEAEWLDGAASETELGRIDQNWRRSSRT